MGRSVRFAGLTGDSFFTIKDNLLIGSSSHALVARSLARCKTNKEVQEVVVSGGYNA